MVINEGEFSNLTICEVSGKKIFIVDSHQFVLPIWAFETARKTWPLNLVSFDYHTDTHECFNQYIGDTVAENVKMVREERLARINMDDLKSLIEAAQDLAWDEHIVTAIKLGIINKVNIIHRSNPGWNKPEIFYFRNDVCNSCLKYNECEKNCPEEIMNYYYGCLEDVYLENTGFSIPQYPFILDFDLDYFPKRSSLLPKGKILIKKLIRNAEIITIAREKDCFDYNKKENFEVEEAITMILELISRCLE